MQAWGTAQEYEMGRACLRRSWLAFFCVVASEGPSTIAPIGPAAPAAAVHGLHTPRFTLDESVLKTGAALHTALASQYLEQWHQQQQTTEPAGGREEL